MSKKHLVKCEWVTSVVMAEVLGIHRQTLLRMRRSPSSPFIEGRDFRWAGLGTTSNLQWHVEATEATFTNPRGAQRLAPARSDNDEDVTLVRYRVVIEEAVVSLEQFERYNATCDKDGYYQDPEQFFACKFEDWQMGCPSEMLDVPKLVQSEDGCGYIAFMGDVRSFTDDVVSISSSQDWKHSQRDKIPVGNSDYFGRMGRDDGAEGG